jgi:Putative transposase
MLLYCLIGCFSSINGPQTRLSDGALACLFQRTGLPSIRSALIERSKTIEGFSDEEINELQIGAVAFIHRFGSTLNEHIHFHICAVDSVFKPTNQGMQFFAAKPFSADFITQVQQTVRRRLLRAFVKRGYIDSVDAKTMQSYAHGGGFSVDAIVR